MKHLQRFVLLMLFFWGLLPVLWCQQDTIVWIDMLMQKRDSLLEIERGQESDSLDREIRFLQASYGLILKDTAYLDADRYRFNRLKSGFWILVDSLAHLSFDSILTPHVQVQFLANVLDVADMDSSHVYWVKMRLRGNGKTGLQHLILPNDDNELWQYVEFYVPQLDGSWQMYQGGATTPISERMTDGWRDFYEVSTTPYADYTVYFRLQGFKSKNRPYNLSFQHLQGDFLSQKRKANTRVYIFIGILVFQFLFFLLWYLMTKENTFVPYLIYILGIVVIAWSSIEFGYWFPNPEFGRHNALNFIQIFFAGVSGMGLTQFTKLFLNTSTVIPKWHKILNGFMGIFTFVLASILFLATIGEWLFNYFLTQEDAWVVEYIQMVFQFLYLLYFVLIPTGFILIVLSGWKAWSNQFQPAKFFLIAIGLLVLFVGPMSLGPAFDFYLFDTFNEGMIMIQSGILLQLCFFALGMGNKRRMLEAEKMETQNQLVETQSQLIEEQNKVNTAFGRFVPHRFLEAIGRDSVLDIKLGDGVEKEVTVFFSDIRGYTRLAEQMTPKENFQFLNGYLGRLGPVISDHHGFVNQYYGDGIMAIFMQQSENALRASLAIQQRLQVYNEERTQKGRIPIKIGIGMHTGPLVMGVIGDTLRMEAGVVSDTVNTAARMEGLTKHFGASILVSETVFDGLADTSEYLYRYLGMVQVKGRIKPLRVYDFFGGDPATVIQQKRETLSAFDHGVKAYYNQDFATAAKAFREVLMVFDGDKSSLDYLEKAEGYLVNGVPEGWSGVVETMVK